MSSSIIFVLVTRVTWQQNKTIRKNISSGWREKKCLSFSPPTPPMSHLERVGFGQKKFFLIFVIYSCSVEHEEYSKMCDWIIRFGENFRKWD